MQRMETLAKKEVVLMRDITTLKPDYYNSMDVRGEPTTMCPCGCIVWNVKVIWDEEDGNMAMYFIDMECAECGTLATAPTPAEDEY